MNYHIEHHMFPMVPYHQLPKLHEAMKPWTREPNHGIIAAYREILPALWRQRTEPNYRIVPVLPGGPENLKSAAE
jgi:fatty acid desaturase